jgi:Rps23 Pro-64 3,4-dihydroxylase Tpa1-like proline 4-hydroxylase
MSKTAGPQDCWPECILDYERLAAIAEEHTAAYKTRAPFPHTVIDDFLPDWVIERLASEFPSPDPSLQHQDNTTYAEDRPVPVQINKVGIQNEAHFSPFVRSLMWELNSLRFLQFLEKLTGIKPLLPDPLLRGGGLHQTKPGGLLQIHADFNKHPIYGYDRRMNVLIYLNKDWKEEWGGQLELWTKDMSKCVRKVSPLAGRCVIFNTSSESWHGHPSPVACPPGNTRKSLALYYYTIGRPVHEDRPAHKVIWRFPPDDAE